jgi:hypothetical protein
MTTRLAPADMRAIVTRWQSEVRQARHSLPALRRFLFRRQAAATAGAGDQTRMVEEFQTILAEVPPETAERLRLLDEFAAVLHESGMMLNDWTHTLDEAEAQGAGRNDDEAEDAEDDPHGRL